MSVFSAADSRVFHWIARLLALVFFIAACDKILHFDAFQEAVENYRLIGSGWAVTITAVSAILFEIALSGLLLAPESRPVGMVLSGMAASFFLLLLIYRSANQIGGDCGCILVGVAKSPLLSYFLVFGLLAASLTGIALMRRGPASEDKTPTEA